jgi:NTE family protein
VQVTLALGSVPMSRYSFETLEILKESAKQWETEWNEANRSRQAIAGGAVEAPPQVKFYLIEVSFDALRDEHERAYFENLPTAFDLPPGAGARLKGVAGKLLNQSETYRALLRDLAGVPPQLEGVSK